MIRLRRLSLVRFGMFSGETLDFGELPPGQPDFHVVCGPNESGKTTIKTAYLRLLYGFPQREPYDFKHERRNLQVGGVLEIDGQARELLRGPQREDSLRDAAGLPVPELLGGALCNVGREEYERLLCLDDESIERGGEEIVSSQGEIGRLLFAASAGLGELSRVIDGVKDEAEELHKPRAVKSRLAVLKRQHKELTEEAKDADVTASAYRELTERLSTARQAEEEAGDLRGQLSRRKRALDGLVHAWPIALRLRQVREELGPLETLPSLADADREQIEHLSARQVELDDRRKTLQAKLAILQAKLAEWTKRREAIPLDSSSAGRRQDLQALALLRDRVATAAADMPKRVRERDDLRQEMRGLLATLRLPEAADPVALVPGETQLARLESRLAEHREALQAEATASAEARNARHEEERAKERLDKRQRQLDAIPDMQSLLDQHDAASLVAEQERCAQAVRRAQRKWSEALSDLTVAERRFSGLPALSTSVAEADRMKRQAGRAEQARTEAHAALQEAEDRRHQAQARLAAAIECQADLVDDAAAAASRAERERLWEAHKANLTESSASSFETALRRDDAVVEKQRRQSESLAELRQFRRQLSETEAARKRLQERHDRAVESEGNVLAGLRDAVAAIGLPEDMSAEEFADWRRRADLALKVREELDRDVEAGRKAEEQALPLARALRALLAAGESAPVNALVRQAERKQQERSKALARLEEATESLEAVQQTRAGREAEWKAAKERLRDTEAMWQEAREEVAEELRAVDLLESLPTLRQLRSRADRTAALQRQIEGMEKDIARFREQLAAFAEAGSGQEPSSAEELLSTFERLREAAEQAVRAAAEHEQLTAEIRELDDERIQAEAEQEGIGREAGRIAARFPTDVPTADLSELRMAAENARRADELRAAVRKQGGELQESLGADSLELAERRLAESDREEAAAELAKVEAEIEAAEETWKLAVKERSQAEAALRAVTGDVRVAELAAEREAVEAELVQAARAYLWRRFGHWIAQAALREYREEHRGEMLEAAEREFRRLTDGAYRKLETMPDGGSEVLLALRTDDDSAKRVSALSKGTRFQLYLALRAAAHAHLVKGGMVLPFLCDDVFETFDEVRTRAACRMMQRIACSGQAVYFTHHRHVADIARAECGKGVRIQELG